MFINLFYMKSFQKVSLKHSFLTFLSQLANQLCCLPIVMIYVSCTFILDAIALLSMECIVQLQLTMITKIKLSSGLTTRQKTSAGS